MVSNEVWRRKKKYKVQRLIDFLEYWCSREGVNEIAGISRDGYF